MKPSLQLRQSQHLALTPQLQQSIRLLQLSTLELDQEIELMLAQNPLLERLDDPLEKHERLGNDGDFDSGDAPPFAQGADQVADHAAAAGHDGLPNDQPGTTLADVFDAHSTGIAPDSSFDAAQDAAIGTEGDPFDGPTGSSERDSADHNDGDGSDRNHGDGELEGLRWDGEASAGSNDSDDWGTNQVASELGTTLTDVLLAQLAGLRCNDVERALVRLLVEEIDEDGYLRTPFDELVAMLSDGLDDAREQLQTALKLLQSFEPCGVGAASLSECLRLQIPTCAQRSKASSVVEALAQRIAQFHLELLATRDYVKLQRLLRCDENELRQAQCLIQSLDPRPGSRFGAAQAGYIVPDVIVRRSRDGWRAALNPDVVPRLRVNELYAGLLSQMRHGSSARGSAATTPDATTTAGQSASENGDDGAPGNTSASGVQRLGSHLQEARWMVKNVHHRYETILRVAQEIVDRQRAFFSHGAVAMRPLVLREIAEAVGLHESTISRATSQKFMLTPFGTLELKYFFGSHVATDSGGAASSTAIRALIRHLVEKEDSHHPLSDSRITELLGEQGMVVARRTVAKYRELLRIAPASQRRAL